MSATKGSGTRLAQFSPTPAGQPAFSNPSPEGSPKSETKSPAGGTHRLPDPPPAHAPAQQPTTPETCWQSFQRAERARAARLRSLWQMTPEQRVAAMRRGDLTYKQLAAWTARHPEQVPTVDGEFERIAAKLPEVCE